MLVPEIEVRRGKTRDHLLSIPYWLPLPDAFLYAVADSLLLHLQGSVAISFWSRRAARNPFFCTWYDRDDASLPAPGGSQRLPRPFEDFEILVERLGARTPTADAEATVELAQLLKDCCEDGSADFVRFLSESLELAANLPERKTPVPPVGQREPVRELPAVPLEPLLALLDGAFDLVRSVPSLCKKVDGVPFFDLVPFLARWSPSPKGASPRILFHTALAPSQLAAAARIAESHSEVDPERLTSALFRPSSQPILRNTFSIGVVGFEDGTVDTLREDPSHIAEERIHPGYWKLAESLAQVQPAHRFLIPLHVGGIPWIVLAHHTDLRRRDLALPYHLYRSVIPRLSTFVRAAAKRTYVQALAGALRQALPRWVRVPDELAREVSGHWRDLGEIYPFDRLVLTLEGASGGGPDAIYLPEARSVRIERGPSFFRAMLSYDALDVAEVASACQHMVEEFLRTELRIELRSLAEASHLLGTRISELETAVANLEEPVGRRALMEHVTALRSLEQFSNFILRDRQERRPTLLRWAWPDFEERVRALVARLQRIQTSRFASRWNRRVAEAANASGGIALRTDESSGTPLHAEVEYFEEHLWATVDNLVSNAIKYADEKDPAFHLSLRVEDARDGAPVTLVCRNRTGRGRASLESLGRQLSKARESSFVGVGLLELACRACGYPQPSWEVDLDQRTLTARVAVGRTRIRKESTP